MRRHPLSDAAREYRSAMWLLAAIAVVAYAVGYRRRAGRGSPPGGARRAECRRRRHGRRVLLRAPRSPSGPRRPGNLLRSHHDRPPRRRAGQQGRRDPRVDRRGAADRRPTRRRSSSRDVANAGIPRVEADAACATSWSSSVPSPSAKCGPCSRPACTPTPWARPRRRPGARCCRARRRPWCCAPDSAPAACCSRASAPDTPTKRTCASAIASCGFPARRSACTRAASPERWRHARRSRRARRSWSPSMRATPAPASGFLASALTMSHRALTATGSVTIRLSDIAANPDGWLVEGQPTLVQP